MAAAVNTLISFIIFYIATQNFSGRYFKINFENRKLLLMIVTGSALASAVYLLPAMNLVLRLITKLSLVIIFPFILFVFKFYEKAELEILTSPAKIIDFIKGIMKGTGKSPDDSSTIVRP